MKDLLSEYNIPTHHCNTTKKIEINLRLGTLFGCVFLGCCILVATLIVYAPDTGVPIALSILNAVKTAGWMLLYVIIGLILCGLVGIGLFFVAKLTDKI